MRGGHAVDAPAAAFGEQDHFRGAAGQAREVRGRRVHAGQACEQAGRVGAYADGVVVGSAIVDRIERAASKSAAIDDVATFIAALKAPLRAPRDRAR